MSIYSERGVRPLGRGEVEGCQKWPMPLRRSAAGWSMAMSGRPLHAYQWWGTPRFEAAIPVRMFRRDRVACSMTLTQLGFLPSPAGVPCMLHVVLKRFCTGISHL